MPMSRCAKCKNFFERERISQTVCPTCFAKEADDIVRARDYVRTHHHPSIQEVADALGVDKSQIIRYVKEDHLQLVHAREK